MHDLPTLRIAVESLACDESFVTARTFIASAQW
jgi:hypothetical protein